MQATVKVSQYLRYYNSIIMWSSTSTSFARTGSRCSMGTDTPPCKVH